VTKTFSFFLFVLFFGACPTKAETPLLRAAAAGELRALRQLPASTDWNQADAAGETALIKAVAHGHADVVRFLVEKKADLNKRDKAGNTALLYAVSNNDRETASLLISAGADLELLYGPKKANILFETARVGAKAIAEDLLSKNKKLLNQPNADGKTPVFAAVENAQSALARFFLARGADARIRTKEGKSLGDVARESGVKNSTPLMEDIRRLSH
jgi:hypothetical protein